MSGNVNTFKPFAMHCQSILKTRCILVDSAAAAATAAKSLQSCPTLESDGVGCHFLLQCMKVKIKVKSLSRVRLFATP